MNSAFEYVRVNGDHTGDNYKYTARDETCKASTTPGPVVHDTGFQDVRMGDAAHFEALQSGPVAVAVDASKWSSYRGGVFSNCGTGLNHGVLLTGYTAEYYTIKNSWGASWGEKGFMRLALGNTCGLHLASSYPLF